MVRSVGRYLASVSECVLGHGIASQLPGSEVGIVISFAVPGDVVGSGVV